MKTSVYLLHKTILSLVFVFCFAVGFGQENKASIKALVESKHFVFKAQTVLPSAMPPRQIAGENYDLRILKDSLVATLPYFGRAFVAPPPGDRGGINLTSTDFEYRVKNHRKGGWEIVITPKDGKDVRQLNLIVFENGNATLQAFSNNRQPISYNGEIAPVM